MYTGGVKMLKKPKRQRFFSKSTWKLAGIIGLFVGIAFFISWIGEFASTKTPEVYTAKQYNSPKQALTFQGEEVKRKDVELEFAKQSQTKDTSQQANVTFTKVRGASDEKKGKTYNFFALSLIFIGIGIVLALVMYYQQASGKESTFELESVKK